MPIFRYEGFKQDGSVIRGTIEAEGEKDALSKIKAGGTFPREISETLLFKKRMVTLRNPASLLPDITRGLATMLSSGVPLIEAVTALSSEQKGQWRGILINIKDRLSAGSPLGRATQAHAYVFPEFYSAIIATGENSGRLPQVLSRLADFLESQSSLKTRVQTALIYPLFMGLVSLFILSFLFTFVVPKITKIFEDTSAALPLITVILISVSTVFQKLWWVLILLASCVALFFRRFMKAKRELIDSLLLRLPFGAFQSLYMARFSMTLSFLLSGGISIIRALELTGRVTGNSVLEKKIVAARNLVSQGAKLSTSLEGFPPTFLQILSTAEKSGQLSEVLEKSAVSYETDFDRKLQRVVRLLEPVLILFMGIVVGFIVVGVLLPIFELNQLIK